MVTYEFTNYFFSSLSRRSRLLQVLKNYVCLGQEENNGAFTVVAVAFNNPLRRLEGADPLDSHTTKA